MHGGSNKAFLPAAFDVVMPDKSIVNAAFKAEIDSMEFRMKEGHTWDRFSKEFVFHVDQKQRI